MRGGSTAGCPSTGRSATTASSSSLTPPTTCPTGRRTRPTPGSAGMPPCPGTRSGSTPERTPAERVTDATTDSLAPRTPDCTTGCRSDRAPDRAPSSRTAGRPAAPASAREPRSRTAGSSAVRRLALPVDLRAAGASPTTAVRPSSTDRTPTASSRTAPPAGGGPSAARASSPHSTPKKNTAPATSASRTARHSAAARTTRAAVCGRAVAGQVDRGVPSPDHGTHRTPSRVLDRTAPILARDARDSATPVSPMGTHVRFQRAESAPAHASGIGSGRFSIAAAITSGKRSGVQANAGAPSAARAAACSLS
ncbi:hypothetical protein SUDANB66_02351 [Streptomyces sp. SudanB66_2053]